MSTPGLDSAQASAFLASLDRQQLGGRRGGGMSTLAKDGADRVKLLRIVDAAMACWPSPGPPTNG